MTGQEGDWRTTLVEVNRKGRGPSKVVVAHLHPGQVSTAFQRSLTDSQLLDLSLHRRMFSDDGRLGLIATEQGAGRLERGRNDATAVFLDRHDADLLIFIDSDMGWDAEAVETLASVMDDTGLPILGGLCFGSKRLGVAPQQAMDTEWFPTLYRWGDGAFETAYEYPAESVVEVAATGAAFLMIHRAALEKIRAAEGDRWFDLVTVDGTTFGEDLSFCLRARDHDLPVHVHTGVRTSHLKDVQITESTFRELRRPSSSAVTVVIPVKDRVDLTRALVGQLLQQGGYTDLLIFDNGSEDPATKAWLAEVAEHGLADVFDAADASTISEMWNAGIDEAVARHGGLADVVFLNNDLELGTRFCQRLVGGMRDTTAMAVSGNYDARRVGHVQPVRGISAGREDGSGGFAGFAFALRAEWIATGYRFPPELHYFSDNDLCLSIDQAGGWYGIVGDARCTHVGGGGQTAGTLIGPSFEKDREFFEAKWAA